jgi:hypothetical protein
MKWLKKFSIRWNNQHTSALLIILLMFTAFNQVKELIGTGLTLNAKRVTGIKDDLVDNSITNLVTQFAVKQAIASLELSTGNNAEFVNIRDYGGFPNATIPVSGPNAAGTDMSAKLDSAIKYAGKNQIVFVGTGSWAFFSALAAISNKTLNLLIVGDTYHNGSPFLSFIAPSGADRQHTVIHMGAAIGRVNMPSHTKGNHDAGLMPWQTMTGTFLSIHNVNRMHAELNKVEGFAKAVEISSAFPGGSQENTIAFQNFQLNAICISLKSFDGTGWVDKNHFVGINGGLAHIGGGLGIKFDGYPNPAGPNNEAYNGAFRSNVFDLMAERLDSLCEGMGDITETDFNITIEGGVQTGLFSGVAYRMLSTGPNVVRGPHYHGRGVLLTSYTTNGMGVNGTIDMQIWNGFNYIGNKAIIDAAGNIVVDVRADLSKTLRDALPSNYRTTNEPKRFEYIDIVAATYTVAPGIDLVRYNNAAGVVTMPAPSTSVNRFIKVRNYNAATLGVANVTGTNSIPGGFAVEYFCDGITWVNMNSSSGGAGGSSPWADNGTWISYLNKVAIGFNTVPSAYLHLKGGTTAAGTAPLKINGGPLNTVPENGAVENDINNTGFYLTYANTRRKILDEQNFAVMINKVFQGVPIVPFYIDGTSNSGYVLTTDGTTNGAAFGPNLGGWIRATGQSNGAISTTLTTPTIPDNSGGEIEVVLRAYDPASTGKMYKIHYVQAYLKDGGTLTLKGSQDAVGSHYTADITPGSAVGGVVTSNTYQIRICSSVAAETLTWTADYIVRPTVTNL